MTVIEQQTGVGLPEEGNLVRVRDQFWVVESVIPSRLLPTTGNGDSTTAHNAVRLVPVDDKGSPDPLTVYWELESDDPRISTHVADLSERAEAVANSPGAGELVRVMASQRLDE